MSPYEKYLKLNIDSSRIGLERNESESNYFCTPKGAKVIGWTGVDGIHYCFVRWMMWNGAWCFMKNAAKILRWR